MPESTRLPPARSLLAEALARAGMAARAGGIAATQRVETAR